MAKNNNLHIAKKEKNDEFYTQLTDIEKELKHYKDYFKGKVVYCNCDDCFESNFFKYFALNFEYLGLKKLIATCFAESKVSGTEMKKFNLWGDDEESTSTKRAYKIEITADEITDVNGDGAFDMTDVTTLAERNATLLNGNGSYNSNECLALLEECDVVVTNPPFSLFRDFIATLEKYGKKYLVIGNQNAITYKEIFPLIKDNKLWLGCGSNLSMIYKTPYANTNPNNKKFVESKGYNPDEGYTKVKGICWFTNIPHNKRNEEIILCKRYNAEEYPTYDNYDAINVDKVVDIPMDYDGVMGVPITFLDKYNPEQFEVIGLLNSSDEVLAGIKATRTYDDFRELRQDGTYTKATGRKTKGNPVLKGKPNKGNYYKNEITSEYVYSTYARILIRKKAK